jgi:hypothetical protein
MNKLKLILLGALMVTSVAGASVSPVFAQPVDPGKSISDGVDAVGGNDPANQKSLTVRVKDIVNVILYVLGAVAVIMIIVGAFRYVLSGGDSGSVTSAKNTILYAVVGLIVAILAYAIVNFVVSSLR